MLNMLLMHLMVVSFINFNNFLCNLDNLKEIVNVYSHMSQTKHESRLASTLHVNALEALQILK